MTLRRRCASSRTVCVRSLRELSVLLRIRNPCAKKKKIVSPTPFPVNQPGPFHQPTSIIIIIVTLSYCLSLLSPIFIPSPSLHLHSPALALSALRVFVTSLAPFLLVILLRAACLANIASPSRPNTTRPTLHPPPSTSTTLRSLHLLPILNHDLNGVFCGPRPTILIFLIYLLKKNFSVTLPCGVLVTHVKLFFVVGARKAKKK